CRYSGVAWYFRKTSSQSVCDSGGRVPTSGFHSTMDSPECVRRVTPPTTTIMKTSAQHAASQPAICLAFVRTGSNGSNERKADRWLARRMLRAGLHDGGGRRRDASHALRAVHGRMETAGRDPASAVANGLGGGFSEIPGDSRVPAREQGHGARRVQ